MVTNDPQQRHQPRPDQTSGEIEKDASRPKVNQPTYRAGRFSGQLFFQANRVRYAAKLLFQVRVDLGKDTGKRRICEERIINYQAESDSIAIRLAKQRGKAAQCSYKNSEGNNVFFEFVGILDIMSLGAEADADEVWYDIKERLLPMERRADILPGDANLLKSLDLKTRR